MKIYKDLFDKIISPENLFLAWDDFKKDKRNKPDVIRFELNLEKNIFKLCRELKNKTYRHSSYTGFYVKDPKQRHIHKAEVRDRILYHALFSIINPIFEETFIITSFSCRIGFGTHKGISVLENMIRKVSRNGFNHCFALKCDIQKFFDSVNHDILLSVIKKRIKDDDALWLVREIIESFSSSHSDLFRRNGLPIGNLTSQLFANVYLNEFDRFVKHALKVKNYVRYTDDFVIVSESREYLEELIPQISEFLRNDLLLNIHPKKISIRKFNQGIDFLGHIIFSNHRIIRTKTGRRIFKKFKMRVEDFKNSEISRTNLEQSLSSYLGVLSHVNGFHIREKLLNYLWFEAYDFQESENINSNYFDRA